MTNEELTEILERYTFIQCEVLKAQVIKAMREAVNKVAHPIEATFSDIEIRPGVYINGIKL